MISGFGDVSPSPKTILFIFGDPRIPQIIQEKQVTFKIFFCFMNLTFLEHPTNVNFGKDGCQEMMTIRLVTS